MLDAEIGRLASLPSAQYLLERKPAAQKWGISLGALDKLVAERRRSSADVTTSDLLETETARLAILIEAEYQVQRKPAARKLRIGLAALDKLVAERRRSNGPVPTPDLLEAEVARLGALLEADYQVQRKPAALKLGIGVTALDKLVRAESQRLLRERTKEERARQSEEARKARARPTPLADGEVRWPEGFIMEPDGLYWTNEQNQRFWLAAPFAVLARTRDAASEAWGLWLRWRDPDRAPHTFAVPNELLVTEPGRLEAELLSRGLHVSTNVTSRIMLRQALAGVQANARARIAYRTGWQGDELAPSFMLADGTSLGPADETVILQNTPSDAKQRCGVAGALNGWKTEVAARAIGNPFAVFCVASAFAAPLLYLAGETGGGFHLFGPAKRGKTLALQVGLSAWGLPYRSGGVLLDWRSSANGLESVAEENTDQLLGLDEAHLANPADLASACYMLADGAGRKRLKRDASPARTRTWRNLILSTGETDLATAVARAGQKLPAGVEARIPSIPFGDATSAWTTLHGHANFVALAKELHRAMRQHHGTAARAFVGRLATEWRTERASIVEVIEQMRIRFAERLPKNADPQVQEVARRCSVVAAGGELAAAWCIVPWEPGEAEQAATAILNAWLARRPGGAGAAEAALHVERVRDLLVQHGAARFTEVALDDSGNWRELRPERPVSNRIGWRKKTGTRDEFLIPSETWRSLVCAPAALDPVATARTLAAKGYLRRGEDNNLAVKERLPDCVDSVRVYAVSVGILEASDDTDAGGAS
jgi:uncharacterized protein (DUF927 family)